MLAQTDHKRRQINAIVTDSNKNTVMNYCCNNREKGELGQEDDVESAHKQVMTTDFAQEEKSE